MNTRFLSGILTFALCAGCNDVEKSVQSRPVALTAAPVQTLPNLAEGTVLLALHPKVGSITGVPYAPPPDADPDRILAAVLNGTTPLKNLGDVEDAKFLADGSLVLVNRAHELIHVTDAAQNVVATHAYAPLSVVGTRVAFTTGSAMPDFQAAVHDVSSGKTWVAPREFMPAWAPVLSDEGSHILFTSGHTGTATLVTADLRTEDVVEDVRPIALPPAGPNAPIWQGDTLLYESEEGLRRLNLRTDEIQVLSGSLPVLTADGRVLVHDGRLREIQQGAK